MRSPEKGTESMKKLDYDNEAWATATSEDLAHECKVAKGSLWTRGIFWNLFRRVENSGYTRAAAIYDVRTGLGLPTDLDSYEGPGSWAPADGCSYDD